MPWNWSVLYPVRGQPYWWDYPSWVSEELEMKRTIPGAFVEYTHLYEGYSYKPSGSIAVDATEDDDRDENGPNKRRKQTQTYIASYQLFPGLKVQRNVTENVADNREREMRRRWEDIADRPLSAISAI